jgi:hypothetical protein
MFVFKLHYNIVNIFQTNQKNKKTFSKEELWSLDTQMRLGVGLLFVDIQ